VRSGQLSSDEMLARLRRWATPIVARVENERVLLDLRAVEAAQDAAVIAALESIFN
jgi:hypothetical protein